MVNKQEIIDGVDSCFTGQYEVTGGNVVPNVADIKLDRHGKEIELAMLFIDIRESTKIVDAFRRITAARMYKSFLWGITQIAKMNSGEVRSFNGDGVLVAFIGDMKRTNATKAALQMSWFCTNILKPRVETYFATNKQASDLEFDFGIGVDVGQVLVVRGGIKGENNNDLVWVGTATNNAVKLASRSKDIYHIYISKDVYDRMNKESKFGGPDNKDMWQAMRLGDGPTSMYRGHWTMTII